MWPHWSVVVGPTTTQALLTTTQASLKRCPYFETAVRELCQIRQLECIVNRFWWVALIMQTERWLKITG